MSITVAGPLPLDRATTSPTSSRAIAHVGMLSDWVLYRLTGGFVTDPSSGSSSDMFDLARPDLVATRRSSWSASIAAVVPEVVEPGTVVGAVTARAAAETGLRAGTPVVVGGADTQLGLVGIGVVAARPVDARRRQLLAADGRRRRAADRPAGPAADALPRGARTGG